MSDNEEWHAGYGGTPTPSDDPPEEIPNHLPDDDGPGGARILIYLDRLEDHRDFLTRIAAKIAAHQEASPKVWSAECLDAAACALAAIHYPPHDPEEARFKAFRRKAFDTTFPIGDRAIRHLKRETAAVIAAIRGLEAMDAIGDPAPPSWDNLSPGPMAREINSRSLTTFRGRIVGWDGG